ncbi:bifunctional metallophosphatase/5'-nucleotidase [Neobacillus sp. 114]|uniref:bifunctional metallophosphatase/5'-nucleotidase n=1 Tax=Neobacillus sp. 114 TaxID=3048535 RepID=UPI0024C31A63|nr:bifunctional metallophosphatase/5'-nucleotidase [Neobacillus sp. 114]
MKGALNGNAIRKAVPALILTTVFSAAFVLDSGRPETTGISRIIETGQSRIHVQLLGVNDFHGQLNVTREVNGRPVGRADYLAAYLKERKAENKNTLIVHAGDMVGASAPVSSLLQEEPAIDVLNRIGFDIGTLGNHEFDRGVKEMLRLIRGGFNQKSEFFIGAGFPYLCANVLNAKTNSPLFPPYKIMKVAGVPIGFIGVVTDDTPSMVDSNAVEGVKFIDEVTAINQAVNELKEQGVKAIIVLAHNEGKQSSRDDAATGEIVDMAKRVDDEVDVMFAGHSHSYLNTEVDGKLLVQAESYGTAFSDVDLEIDPETKDIVRKKAEIVVTYHDGIKPAPEMKALIEKYETEVTSVVDEIVGTAAFDIAGNRNENGESALGNLIADSERSMMNTDFAFMNPGGIRADLQAGTVTHEELLTILPFHHHLVKMRLTGEQIRQVLNQQWQQGQVRMLQVSGLRYTWNDTKASSDKVVDMFIDDGVRIQPEKTYTVTVTNYLSNGGDHFTVFQNGTNKEIGPIDVDSFKEYMKQDKKPIRSFIDGRVLKVH